MSSALTLTHNLPKDVTVIQAPLVAEFNALMESLNTLQEVVDADSCTAATLANTALCKLSSKIEAARKALTKPIDDLKKACMAKEKEFTKPIEDARAAIEAELTGYLRKTQEEARQRECVRQAEQNTATAFGEVRMTPALVAMEPQPEVGALKTRRTPHLVVTSYKDIPEMFLTVKEGPLKAWLLSNAEAHLFKGAHIEWRDEVVA